jgi:hypothetical protein
VSKEKAMMIAEVLDKLGVTENAPHFHGSAQGYTDMKKGYPHPVSLIKRQSSFTSVQ